MTETDFEQHDDENEDRCIACGEREREHKSDRCRPCNRDRDVAAREAAYDLALAEWKDER